MDQELSGYSGDPIVVTGVGLEVPVAIRSWFEAGGLLEAAGGAALSHDADPVPFLRVRKSAKFMSKQDRLALASAARAVQSARLTPELLDTQVAISMCVGVIPFKEDEAVQVAERSRRGNEFSMEAFSRDAYEVVNPMLVFACLPNMPAYHLSVNLGIRGGYYLTYPSCVESYMALQNAVDALSAGQARAVLFGAAADQQNFLALNHQRKTGQTLPAPDCACFLVLETESGARERKADILARMQGVRVRKVPGAKQPESCCFGPVDLPLAVARFVEGMGQGGTHRVHDQGYLAESEWSR